MPESKPPAQYLSARRFSNPSPLFRWAETQGLLDKPSRALVFGAGHLLEAEVLLARGWQVDAHDTPDCIGKLANAYSAFGQQKGARVLNAQTAFRPLYRLITLTHVLEFIQDPQRRHSTLQHLGERLSKEGIILLSLRGWSDVNAAKTKRKDGDGITTGLGTWTRGYSVEKATALVRSCGLHIYRSPMTTRAMQPEQVRIVCKR